MTIPNNKPQIDFFNNPQSIGGFNLSGIEWLTTPSKTDQMVNNPVYQDALTSQISQEVQQDPRTLPFYKRWNIAADLGYNEDSMIENINESMKSGMIPTTASSYDRRVIWKLKKAIEWWLQPIPELIMEAVPEIPYNVAYKIANQQPPKISNKDKILWQAISMISPMPWWLVEEAGRIVRDIDYVDPTFQYQTLEQTQDMNLMWVRGEKPNRDILVEQLSVPQFVFENWARLLWNLPSAVANAAIFVSKLAFDPWKTILETVQWIAAIPEAVRQDMVKSDNISGKFQRFIDGTMKFVVENPDIVLAPEAALRGRGIFSTWIPWPLPEWVAPSTIESIVKERLASKWLEQTVENVTKEANTLYNEILENPQSWQDYDVPQDIKNQASVYRWENAQWQVVYRPDTQNIVDDLNINKDIQQTFWQTIRWVRTPQDIARKTKDFATTMELVLDNRDTLPTMFPDGRVSKKITVFDFAEAADVTKNDFWNNIIEPAFSAMDELDIMPSTRDTNFLSNTIQNSLDGMMVNWKLTPISKKAYNTIQEYLDILTTPWITILDMQRISQQINAATKQLYGWSSMSPANMFEQTQLAWLNIILRDIIDKHTTKLLWDMKMKDLKKQRWAIRWSIEQITKRWQVLDRQATNSLTDVIWSSFGISEIIWWAAFGRPEMIVSWVAMKWIQSYQKYMNSPNRKLRKMLEKIDDYRDWFKVPWWFSSQWQVAYQIQSKIDEIVNNYQAEKAAKQRIADIQDDFAKTIQAELVKEPVTSIRVAGIEITPEWVIRQPWVETPTPRSRSVIEIDQFTPAKAAREEAAKTAAEMQTKQNQRLAELVQKTRASIIDKRLYDFARENGTLVQWSDVFNGIRRWDVTQYGIVDWTTIDWTKYKIRIQGMENTISPYDVQDGVYRLSEDPRNVLMRITEEVDEALSKNPTTESMKDLVKKFEDELWESEIIEKTTDLNEPQQEIAMRAMKVENQPKAQAPDTPLNEFIDEMEASRDTSLMNDNTENFSTEWFWVSRATAAAEVLDYIWVEWASLDTLVNKMSELPIPISDEVQRIARMRNPERALEAVEKLKVEYQDMVAKVEKVEETTKLDIWTQEEIENMMKSDIEDAKRRYMQWGEEAFEKWYSAPITTEITTNLMQDIKSGKKKDIVSKQFVLDLMKNQKYKKTEKQALQRVIDDVYGNDKKVSIANLEDKLRNELLYLNDELTDKYADYNYLKDDVWYSVDDQKTRMYITDIDVWNSNHFGADWYFAHTRYEDIWDTRRLVELQSDLMQSEKYKKYIDYFWIKNDIEYFEKRIPEQKKELEKIKKHVDMTPQEFIDSMKIAENSDMKRLMYNRPPNDTWYTANDIRSMLDNAENISEAEMVELKNHFDQTVNIEQKEKDILENEMILESKREDIKEIDQNDIKNAEIIDSYNKSRYERIIKEEIKKAAQDWKKELHIPIEKTISKIEWHIWQSWRSLPEWLDVWHVEYRDDMWMDVVVLEDAWDWYRVINYDDVDIIDKQTIADGQIQYIYDDFNYVWKNYINENNYEKYWIELPEWVELSEYMNDIDGFGWDRREIAESIVDDMDMYDHMEWIYGSESIFETPDWRFIIVKDDTSEFVWFSIDDVDFDPDDLDSASRTVYDFYTDKLQKYVKKNFDAENITDDAWYPRVKIKVDPDAANKPIIAYQHLLPLPLAWLWLLGMSKQE